jgi:hypothetical protein
MAELTGAALYAEWRYPATTFRSATIAAGTLRLDTDFRKFTPISDKQGSVSKAAGADTNESYLPTLRDATLAASVLHDGGTLLQVQLSSGLSGTLVYGSNGTANGASKITMPVFIETSALDQPFTDVMVWDVTFKPTAAGTYGTWASGV